ncbi:glycerophosphodiester phosphodiesterase GDPDL3-like [Wolffia australiana]
MGKRRWVCDVLFALVLLARFSTPGNAQKWLTLDGKQPLVIAKGGNSGVFPDSSSDAYGTAQFYSLPGSASWCDVRLTKDGVGICLPDINMANCTTISIDYPARQKKYLVNGVSVDGWFSVDFTFKELSNSTLWRSIGSRSQAFDNVYPILPVNDVPPAPLWLNIEHDKFYSDHKLNMTQYFLSITKVVAVDHVSSPELSFLQRVAPLVNTSKTEIVFRFLDAADTEPSTGRAYHSLLTNLTFIRTFASAIIVPKGYIWPVSSALELAPTSTSLVRDAHRAGLKVYASGFANDFDNAYNYSFDPSKEYLGFTDNGQFSIDGALTDFPLTASAAIGCLAHGNSSRPSPRKPVVVSYGGSGGMFPSCTDLAYKKAVEDGTDFIDCPVQVTKDGVLICMIDIDLLKSTNVASTTFFGRSILIPEINAAQGVYTFNLTWAEIQTGIKPQISAPFTNYNLFRNPVAQNVGAFLNLTQFLALAKENPPRSGVLISIEHARFLVENLGFDVTAGVVNALNTSNLKQEIIIQSTDSSVLLKIQELPSSYKFMYKIDKPISDVLPSAAKDIAKFASYVAVPKSSIYIADKFYLLNSTSIVPKLKAANLSVFSYLFQNEFVSLWWDASSDPMVEINTFVNGALIDGLITEFPATADAFRRAACSSGGKGPMYWQPVSPGMLVSFPTFYANVTQPPAGRPLSSSDIVQPPLPSAPPVASPSMPPAPLAPPPVALSAAPPLMAATAAALGSVMVLLLQLLS